MKREAVLSKTGCSENPERVWDGVCVRVRVCVGVDDRVPVELGVDVTVADCVRVGVPETERVPDVLAVALIEFVRLAVCEDVKEGDMEGDAVTDWLGVSDFV